MKRKWTFALALTVLLVAAIPPLAPVIVEQSVRLAGYDLHIGAIDLGFTDSHLRNVSLEHRGASARIAQLDIQYHPLRIVLDHPELSVLHTASGEWILPVGGGQAAGSGQPSGTPNQALPHIDFALTILDGTLALHTANPALPVGREVTLQKLNVQIEPQAGGNARLQATATYQGSVLEGAGQTDYDHARIVGEITSPRIPLAGLVNAYIDNPAFVVDHAIGQALHLGVVITGHDKEAPQIAYYGSTAVTAGEVHVQGIVGPLRDITGPLDLTSHGITSLHLHGTIAGQPFEASGGLSNFAPVRLHLRAHIAGEASQLRQSLAALAKWPLRGAVAGDLELSGPLSQLLFLVRIDSPHLDWDAVALEEPHLDLAVKGSQLSLLTAHAHSGTAQVTLGGTVGLGGKLEALLVGHGETTFGHVRAAVALEDRGGEAVTVGEGPQFSLAAAGRLERDRSQAWAAFVAEQAAGRYSLGHLQLNQGLLLAGIQSRNVALPNLVGTLDGSAALATLSGKQFVQADLQARSFAPALLTRFAPSVPAALAPQLLAVRAYGDPRALVVQQALVVGRSYAVSAHGLAGREQSAVLGQVDANLPGISSALEGRVSGPFAVISQGQQVDGASPGLGVIGGKLGGVGFDQLAGHLHLAKVTTATVAMRTGAGSAAVWGQLGGRIGVVLKNVALPSSLGQGAGGRVDAVGWMDGVHARAGIVMHDGQLQGLPLGGIGVIARSGNQAELSAGALRFGTVLASLVGHVGWNPTDQTPAYTLDAKVSNAEIASLLFNWLPQSRAYRPEASLSANVHIRGVGSQPTLTASLNLPHGMINDYALRDGHAMLRADRQSITLADGALDAGGSHLRFEGSTSPSHKQLSLQATAIDVGGVVDAFAPQYTADGFGTVSVIAGLQGSHLRSTGTVELADLRWNDLRLGHAFGHWDTQNGWIAGHLAGSGSHTQVALDGKIAPRLNEQLQVQPSSQMALVGQVTNLDLASRLALLGVRAPLTGSLDMQTNLHGTLGSPQATVNAHLHDASILGMAIVQATLDAALVGGKVELRQAKLVTNDLVATASGNLSRLAPTAPLVVVMQANSPHLQSLLQHITGRVLPVDGVGSTRFIIDGTLRAPHFGGAVAIDHGMIGGVPITEALARYELKASSLQIEDAEVDFMHGSITAAGSLPLTLAPLAIGPATAPLAVQLGVNAVDLGILSSLLPSGNSVLGQLNGALALQGTPGSPTLLGALHLTNAALDLHPKASIDHVSATARFVGTSATLQAAAKAGGGSVALNGSVNVPHLTDLTSPTSSTSFSLNLKTNEAHFSLPGMGEGTLNGTIALTRQAGQGPDLAGDLSLSEAVIPAASLMNQRTAGSATPSGIVGETNLNLGLHVGHGVRMRSGAIDIGANGAARVDGTVAHPTMAGTFVATGGTVTYLNRSFRVQQGRVVFDGTAGLTPLIDATATTVVTDPDPSSIRNSSGQATITLNIHGQPDHLVVALSSDPSYSREQILGLLVDASLIRAVDFNSTDSAKNGGLAQVNQAGQTGQVSLQNEALGLLDAQVTQSLLSPLTSAIGGAVGLSDLGVSIGTTGSVGLTARRRLNGNLSLFFEESIGLPTRTSVGINFNPNEASALSLSVYQDEGVASDGHTSSALYEPSHLGPVSAGGSGSVTRNGVLLSIRRRFP